jgi:hypothetical protein
LCFIEKINYIRKIDVSRHEHFEFNIYVITTVKWGNIFLHSTHFIHNEWYTTINTEICIGWTIQLKWHCDYLQFIFEQQGAYTSLLVGICTSFRCVSHDRKNEKVEYYCVNKKKHKDRGSFDRNSLDRNCDLSVDRNFYNQLTEIFDTFHLTELFFTNLTWPNLT